MSRGRTYLYDRHRIDQNSAGVEGSYDMKRKSGCQGILFVSLLLLGCGTLMLAQDSAGQSAAFL